MDRDELEHWERRLLTPEEQKTLAALRHDAQSGPPMYEDAVALIERLLERIAQSTED